jgi:hypothetical protein
MCSKRHVRMMMVVEMKHPFDLVLGSHVAPLFGVNPKGTVLDWYGVLLGVTAEMIMLLIHFVGSPLFLLVL